MENKRNNRLSHLDEIYKQEFSDNYHKYENNLKYYENFKELIGSIRLIINQNNLKSSETILYVNYSGDNEQREIYSLSENSIKKLLKIKEIKYTDYPKKYKSYF